MFLALEGIDAAGKNTQSNQLLKHFSEIVGEEHVTKFDLPKYDTVTGQMIRDHLEGKWKIDAKSDLSGLYNTDPSTYLFQCCQLVNRMESLPDKLWNQGKYDVFIADRYNASAYAYGTVFGLDLDWLLKTHRNLPQPDLNIFLDITVEESFARRPERRDEYEKNTKLLNDVRAKYLELFERLGPSYVVIDASGTKEETFAKIVRQVHSLTDNDNALRHFSQMF